MGNTLVREKNAYITKIIIRVIEQTIGTNIYRRRIIGIGLKFSNNIKKYLLGDPSTYSDNTFDKERDYLRQPIMDQKYSKNPMLTLVDQDTSFVDKSSFNPTLNTNIYNIELDTPNGFDEFKLGGYSNPDELKNNPIIFSDIQRIGLFKSGGLVAEYIGESTITGNPMPYTSNFTKSINKSLVNGFLLYVGGQIGKVYYKDPQFDGGWSDWITTNECKKQDNGTYTQFQTRTCTNPAPTYTGQDCEGLDSIYCAGGQDCTYNAHNSRTVSCSIDGGWGDWITNAECKKQPDGTYKQAKKRLCNKPEPKYGGKDCIGDSTELISCNPPIDGGWNDWITNAECKKQTDGTYKQAKKRLCNKPEPKYGGNVCIGNSTELISCKTADTTVGKTTVGKTTDNENEMMIFILFIIIVLIFGYKYIRSKPPINNKILNKT